MILLSEQEVIGWRWGEQERKWEDTGRRMRKREEKGSKDKRWESRKIKERGKGNERRWKDRIKRCSWQCSGSVGLQGQTLPCDWDSDASGVTYWRKGKTSTQTEEEGK